MSHSRAKSRCVRYSKDSLPPGQRAGGLQPIEKYSGFLSWGSSPAAQPPTCAGGITWRPAEHPVGTRLREPARKMMTLWIPVVLGEVNFFIRLRGLLS